MRLGHGDGGAQARAPAAHYEDIAAEQIHDSAPKAQRAFRL